MRGSDLLERSEWMLWGEGTQLGEHWQQEAQLVKSPVGLTSDWAQKREEQ